MSIPTQIKTEKPEALYDDSEIKNTLFLKQLEANFRLPQSEQGLYSFAAAGFYNAIIQRRNRGELLYSFIEELGCFDLSENEIMRLGEEMTRVHRNAHVPYAAEHISSVGEIPLKTDALIELWRNQRMGGFEIILDLIDVSEQMSGHELEHRRNRDVRLQEIQDGLPHTLPEPEDNLRRINEFVLSSDFTLYAFFIGMLLDVHQASVSSKAANKLLHEYRKSKDPTTEGNVFQKASKAQHILRIDLRRVVKSRIEVILSEMNSAQNNEHIDNLPQDQQWQLLNALLIFVYGEEIG
jgi:hypothetical protein